MHVIYGDLVHNLAAVKNHSVATTKRAQTDTNVFERGRGEEEMKKQKKNDGKNENAHRLRFYEGEKYYY